MSKPQTWFRFYNEVVDDPKVQRLPLLLFRAWINLMCLASKNGGVLPETSDIAYRLRVTESRAAALVQDLIEAELLDKKDGWIQPHNWEGRQFKSDSSTDRVKRFRNAECNVSETADETPAPEHTQQTDPPIVPQGDLEQYHPDFEIFWAAYPRKAGKAAAWKAWKKLKPSQALQEIILRAVAKARASQQWQKDNGQFIPHPATWLNRGQWEDDYTPITQPKALHVAL